VELEHINFLDSYSILMKHIAAGNAIYIKERCRSGLPDEKFSKKPNNAKKGEKKAKPIKGLKSQIFL